MRIHEITESIAGAHSDILVRQSSNNAHAEYREHKERILEDLVHRYDGEQEKPRWRVVPATKLKSIWEQSHQAGFVRNTKGLDQVAALFFDNIARLDVNGAVLGHGGPGENAETMLADLHGDELPDEWTPDRLEEFANWCAEYPDGWRYSDHGFPRLAQLACLLKDCSTAEETLMVCDAILNVVHPSSDLAAWFVEGGQMTLSEIAHA